MILCDRCGKKMQVTDTMSTIGVCIKIMADDKDRDIVLEQFGKYAYKDNWNFCFECWINSLLR